MKIISYLDNDQINKPNTKDTAVYALEIERYTSKEQIIEQHPEVFHEGVGKLDGEYHIRLNKNANPVHSAHSQTSTSCSIRVSQGNTRQVSSTGHYHIHYNANILD